MRIEIDVRDDKADFVLELLRNLKFVKVKETEKERILSGLRESIQEVKDAKAGKVKLLTAKELLDGL